MDGPSGWIGSYTLVDNAPARVAPFFERLRQRPYRIDPAIDFEGRTFRFHFLNDSFATTTMSDSVLCGP